jgi:hypothetical protein
METKNGIEIEIGTMHIEPSNRRPGSGARALAGSSHDAQGRDHQPVRVRRDEDAGRYRLTFFHKSRGFRLIVDGTGTVLQRSIAEVDDRALPASMRNPTPGRWLTVCSASRTLRPARLGTMS